MTRIIVCLSAGRSKDTHENAVGIGADLMMTNVANPKAFGMPSDVLLAILILGVWIYYINSLVSLVLIWLCPCRLSQRPMIASGMARSAR